MNETNIQKSAPHENKIQCIINYNVVAISLHFGGYWLKQSNHNLNGQNYFISRQTNIVSYCI